MDGDGYAELLAGEPYATIDSEKEGRVYLIDGDDIINAGTGSVDALVILHLKVFQPVQHFWRQMKVAILIMMGFRTSSYHKVSSTNLVIQRSVLMKIWVVSLWGSSLQSGSTYTFDQRDSTFVAQKYYTGMGWGNAVGDVDFDGDDDFMIGAPSLWVSTQGC